MATSTIKKSAGLSPQIVLIEHNYTINANSTYNTNLKTLVDNNMPNGYHFGGLCGYASNNVQVLTTNFGYYDSAYSLQLANRGNSQASNMFRIFFIAIPD